jgi:hypothetical protein
VESTVGSSLSYTTIKGNIASHLPESAGTSSLLFRISCKVGEATRRCFRPQANSDSSLFRIGWREEHGGGAPDGHDIEDECDRLGQLHQLSQQVQLYIYTVKKGE